MMSNEDVEYEVNVAIDNTAHIHCKVVIDLLRIVGLEGTIEILEIQINKLEQKYGKEKNTKERKDV